jgi:SAM-dependent methyltransferase
MPPSPPPPAGNAAAIDRFIAYWQGQEGGQERANYQLFLIGLAEALGMPRPDAAGPNTDANQYVFERAVTFREPDGTTSTGRIDLYRRGSFVLEAKQSRQKGQAKAIPGQSDLFVPESEPRGGRGATRAWDVLMLNARRQAEDYAKALPTSDGWPPFLLICDVGHCIEVFADFSGQGKNYNHFPDRNSYRIYLEDLRTAETQDRLRLIWNDPQKLDPAKRSARVTREIAERLAEVSKALEKRDFPAEDVALFLMRCLFTMFAEDVELLPKASFKDLLERCAKDEKKFAPMVEQLWQAMDVGDFAFGIETKVPRFNGKLFKAAKALPLRREEIGELLVAAKADWKQVEPAIFGTLLEQALDVKERARLGAHYTPRAFVERLVVATVIEPLRADWLVALATAERLNAEKKHAEARKVIGEFHSTLCQTRVLDPACGTGNFLYVALELMKRLEGEVLEAVVSLGGQEGLSWLDRQTVDPHQFLGIEKNPRAAAIAELVVWLGYLQWHFRTRTDQPPEPILRDFKNIEARDAVLDWDGAPLAQVSRVDGKTIETHPNARRPVWWTRPEDEPTFIVGNPPFIGGKDLRANLGDAYTEAPWSVHDDINESADFVMYWWDRAAEIVTKKGSITRRFGFVTTNSITQVFSRRTIERHLGAKQPISLLMAIPDHPWTKMTTDDAAVRIAMTVAAAGAHEGTLREVSREAGLDSDQPEIELVDKRGIIHSDLTVGPNLAATASLKASDGVCSRGVVLHGAGFIVTPAEAIVFGLGRRKDAERRIRPYRNGRDLMARSRGVFALDLFGMTDAEVRAQYPEVYQHVLEHVKPERDTNRRDYRRLNWWLFGENNPLLRRALDGLPRYIATVETSKHRVFQFLDAEILPDNMLVALASDDAIHLGVLQSRSHVTWALRAGGWLGVGNDPRYSKSRCFDPFPFPTPDRDTADEIRAIAEELDKHRKDRQAEHPSLTLTDMYNVLEKLRGGVALDDDDRRIKDQGLVLMLKEYHDRLDAAVARAYGWPVDLTDEQILERLVALNAERAEEEKSGRVRWLRPDYQIPRFGSPAEKARWQREQAGERPDADDVHPAQGEMLMAGGASAITAPIEDDAAKPKFPTNDEMAETAAVMTALLASAKPMTPTEVARHFKGGKQNERRVKLVLDALSRLGHLSSADGGESFALRRGG